MVDLRLVSSALMLQKSAVSKQILEKQDGAIKLEDYEELET